MKKILLAIFIISTGIYSVTAQQRWQKNKIEVPSPVCYASGEVEKASVPPPREILNKLKSGAAKKSDIIVEYVLFPDDAKQAFDYAVSIWETIIESPIPIYVRATWRKLDTNVLGSAGPSSYYQNFENTPHQNRFYPVSIAEKITGTEISGPEAPDITAEFNKTIKWYFGTDLSTPDSLYDFVTVVMHELAHGLGFNGFFFVSGNEGMYVYEDFGDAAAFDLLVIKNTGEQLVDTAIFENQSLELKEALTSGSLYANSPVALDDGNGFHPRLYVPSEWEDGSSLYHLNDAHYPSNNPNSLMTHAIGRAKAIHNPGPLTSGILADIGWKHMFLDFTPLKDIEQTKPLDFELTIESDYELDTTSISLVYSLDDFQTQPDTISILPTETVNLFATQVIPEIETGTISYYISAGDVKGRTFKLPTEAPREAYTINIGPDSEIPWIEHEPIAYHLISGKKLEITAEANDNLGVDTVFVQYSINGIAQAPFGLKLDSANVYTGYFNFDENTLTEGDIIDYQIYATDASTSKNMAVSPAEGTYSFEAEGIYEPVISYINNFNAASTDFIISDFEIYTEDGFDNGALHSPHPYPSSNDNNEDYNFSTVLKRPIIIQENGSMTFDEIVLVEPGENNSDFGDIDFWDYVIVEGSKDFGITWLPLAEGYDSRRSTVWRTTYNEEIVDQVSTAIGTPELYISNGIDFVENGNFAVGDTILIKFRLFADPYANGWGWAIDNLRIQQPVSAPITELSPGNIKLYPNPFENEVNLLFETNTTGAIDIQVDFYNTYGQKLKSFHFDDIYGNTTKTIGLEEFTKGMYLVNILEDGQKVTSRKLIKR